MCLFAKLRYFCLILSKYIPYLVLSDFVSLILQSKVFFDKFDVIKITNVFFVLKTKYFLYGMNYFIILHSLLKQKESSGCSSVGRVRVWGAWGRKFKSSHPDRIKAFWIGRFGRLFLRNLINIYKSLIFVNFKYSPICLIETIFQNFLYSWELKMRGLYHCSLRL